MLFGKIIIKTLRQSHDWKQMIESKNNISESKKNRFTIQVA